MFRRFLTAFSLIALLATAAFVTTPINAFAEEKKSAFSDEQRAELHAIIKQFVLDNPQSLITSVETYYNKQNDSKKAQEGRVDQVPAGLYDTPGTPYAGNKDSKFVVVEFFDYNCGYCKQVTSDVNRIIKEEGKNLKFVFIELPILSEMSEVAARYALAANMQGKYLDFHTDLMNHQGPIDPSVLESIAKGLEMDIVKLKKDADSQEVRDILGKNLDLARTLGVRGTPFFLIGKTKVPGALGYTKMKEVILKERDGIAVPTAPTPSVDTGSAIDTTGSSSGGEADPDVKAAIEEAKKETGDMLKDLQKQAEDMKKAAEDMLKQQQELEAKKAAAGGAAAPAAPTEMPAEKK